MDPVSVLTSVLATALSIKRWVDDTAKKDQAVRNLSATINLVCIVLSPLEDRASIELKPTVVASLLGITEVLGRIKDHLSLWKDKRFRLNRLLDIITPRSVMDDLRDDSQLLSHHLAAVQVALQVSSFVDAGRPASAIEPQDMSVIGIIYNVQVRGFWRDMIGETVRTYENFLKRRVHSKVG